MNRIVLDGELAKKLAHTYRPAELVDASGRVLGQFVPPISEEDLDPGVSEEELQRRERSDKWYTTAEVLDHLKKLEEREKS